MVLADGGTVHLRPIRPDDAGAISSLHARLSPETIYYRFFSPLTTLSPRLLERFVHVDYVNRLALVAVLGDDIIAVGRYERLPTGQGDEAEVAFLVDDAHQGRGLGTVLLEHLAAIARLAGITRFVADTLPDNNRMLRVFHEAGFDDERTFADGVVRVAFPIEPTEASVTLAHQREQRATARSVRRLLAPRSVAVIGASRRPGTIGHRLLETLLDGRFAGPVYPVHPQAEAVCSVRAYRSVVDIPDPVDLAVVAVPAAAVAEVVEACVRKHVGGLVVVSSGFSERSPEGAEAERALVAEARRNGMRVVGPNCMGVVNTDPAVRLNATFSPMPPPGGVGVVAQSGALGAVILDELGRRGLGVSTFVSAGNKADVSGNDLLQYWEDDPATAVIGMYIETFGNPRTFARVARRLSRRKPIVAVKSARSAAGVAAGGGRPGQPDEAVDALFRHTGVVRTSTLEELFDVAQVLAAQPHPPGRRVAIVGSSGGTGVLAADACAAGGLEVVELHPDTRARLRHALPDHGSVANPVDLRPTAVPGDYGAALAAVLADRAVDAAIALYTAPLEASTEAVAGALVEARVATPAKPVVACLLGHRGLVDGGAERLPSFAFPEAAARALAKSADYAEWLRRPEGALPADGPDADEVHGLVAGLLAGAGGRWLPAADAARLLGCYGIEVPVPEPAGDPDATAAAASRVGYPVVVEVDPGPERTVPPRRSLRLALPDEAAARAAWAELAGAGPLVVAPFVGPGWDVTVTVTQDPLFGPLVTLGAGGRIDEPPRHSASRTAPLTDVDAADLRAEVVGHRQPDGVPWDDGDLAALDRLLVGAGRLAADVPEVAEAQLHPVVVGRRAAVPVGVAVRLAPVDPHPERALRRLR